MPILAARNDPFLPLIANFQFPHLYIECLLMVACVPPHIVEWCDGLCTLRREGDSGWERAVDDLLFTVSVSG